jgi:hypothetical protein
MRNSPALASLGVFWSVVTSRMHASSDALNWQLEKLRDKRLRQAKIEQVRRKRWEAKGRGGYEFITESGLFTPHP